MIRRSYINLHVEVDHGSALTVDAIADELRQAILTGKAIRPDLRPAAFLAVTVDEVGERL